MSLTIGQKLWYVRRRHYAGAETFGVEVSVVKIGRKWATLSEDGTYDASNWRNLLVDISQPNAERDGYIIYDYRKLSSRRRAYLDKEAYEYGQRLRRAWTKFAAGMTRLYTAPEGVTLQQIMELSRVLGVAQDEPTVNTR